MVARKAIAATLASVLIFGSLIVSNFALVAAEEQREQLASIASEENYLSLQGQLVIAETALTTLDHVQSALAGKSFSCTSFQSQLDSILAAASARTRSGGINASSRATIAPDGIAFDNMTILRPFAGSIPGALDVSVAITGLGQGSSWVSFAKSETHNLFIPVYWREGQSLCESSDSRIVSVVSSLGSNMCNQTILGGVMQSLDSYLVADALRDGYALILQYSLNQAPPCSFDFSLSVSQTNVAGPLGPFTWTVATSGSVSR